MTRAGKRWCIFACVAVFCLLASALFAWHLFVRSSKPSLQEWVQEVKRPTDKELYTGTSGERYLAVFFRDSQIVVCDSQWASNNVSEVEVTDKSGNPIIDLARKPVFLTRGEKFGPFDWTVTAGVAYPILVKSREIRIVYSLQNGDAGTQPNSGRSTLLDIKVFLWEASDK